MGAESLTYAVSHRTTLRYSERVSLSYNEVRMRPRDRGGQRTLAFSLLSTPAAAPRSRVDYYGNYVHRVDVTTPHQVLEFTVDAVVENSEPRRRRLTNWTADSLASDPRLEFSLPSPRVPIAANTRSLWKEWTGGDNSFDAVVAAAERIPRELRYVTGATTVESSIDELLEGGAGVCQDFTHLFLAMVRGAGWPARYVSGYLGPADETTVFEGQSHAWVEVCGADGRWVGLDPTHGRFTGVHHLRLAVGRDYGDVAPHHGLFFGAAVGSAPEVTVRIERISNWQPEAAEPHAAVHWQQQQQQQASQTMVEAPPSLGERDPEGAERDTSLSAPRPAGDDVVAALHRTIAELAFLASLARTTSSALDPDELFGVIIKETCRVLDVPVCSLYVVQDRDLVLRATNGLNPAGVGFARMPIGVGITGTSARLKSMIPLADARSDPRFHWIDGIDEDRFTAMCSVPLLRADERVVGVLNVQRQDAHDWTVDEKATLTAIASQLAGVFERTQLQRQLEERLVSEQEATKRWRQLTEARSDLLSMVSHDVRTPLAIALTYVEALHGRLRGEEQTVAQQIGAELVHINRMVEAILSALAVESGFVPLVRRDVDLVLFLREVVTAMQAVAEGRRILLSVSLNALVVEVDADRLRQVMRNLLANAVQHAPPGSPIVVGLHADDGGAVITVTDTGPGVPTEMRATVFEKFRQSRPHDSGTGVGLFVVRTIVEAHGGSAGVDGGHGGGARFWVRLPID
ncbi:MAG: hypothetical protein NVSMB29_01310 [Candidatus Dormibacteria bacterium]